MATFSGVATGTTTATMPAHAAGHMLFAWAYRDGTAVVPTVPAGWTTIVSGAEDSQGFVLCYRLATANNHTTGTFTSASRVVVMVYAPGAGEALGIGKSSKYAGFGDPLYLQPGYDSSGSPVPLTKTDGSSWVLAFAGNRSVNTALEKPPAGLTYRGGGVDSTAEAQAFDSGGGLTKWPASGTLASVSVGGTSGSYYTAMVEMTVTSGGGGVTGSASITEASDTVSATGALPITGTTSATEAADTITATARLRITGAASITEASDTSSSAARVAIAATTAITEANDNAASAAKLAIKATAYITEASDTASSTARLSVRGSASITEDGDSLSSSGALTSGIAATANITEENDNVVSFGALYILGNAAIAEDSDAAESYGQKTTTQRRFVTIIG